MLRGLRHPAAALAAVVLLAPVLAACGSNAEKKADSSSAASLDSVSFTGEVGKDLKATWRSTLKDVTSTKITTLVKGDGAKIASGDSVSTYLWIGDGASKKAVYDDYTNGAAETIPVNAQLSGVIGELFKGSTYGSRVAAVTTGSEVFGPSGNSQLGISADADLVVVADLVKKAPVSPTPSSSTVQNAPASAQPKVVSKAGKPSGLSWSGVKEPALTTPVQRVVLKKGTGAAIKATDTITINYLGETYKATKPFDESYSKQALTSPLSGLIKGWSIGLTGVKVGSRVLLQIPPAYGYGAQGSPPTIPANATLWFVIDVVATK